MRLPALVLSLFLLVAAFAGIFRHIRTTPVDVSQILPTHVEKTQPLAEDWSIAAPDTILGDTEISATLARPLFNRDRKPFIPPHEPESRPEPSEEVVEIQSEASELILLGVSLGGGQSRALVAGQDSSGNWVRPGDTIQSWTIKEIRSNEVSLTRGNEKAELQLYPHSVD